MCKETTLRIEPARLYDKHRFLEQMQGMPTISGYFSCIAAQTTRIHAASMSACLVCKVTVHDLVMSMFLVTKRFVYLSISLILSPVILVVPPESPVHSPRSEQQACHQLLTFPPLGRCEGVEQLARSSHVRSRPGLQDSGGPYA
ncbi:hypothetical protein RRG08_022434 [Elysia crispata]|uniref:Uncharacterized protein n=1 Tax=Elysia crispata TaxID=231223 RepID=A0AAE0Z1D9_9GAST|nr:hypothetical protein RRG08_022434 [Elysia crispata]